jgi:hypothetical protein
VMLSVSGEVKLMDFGIARLASEDTSGLFVKGKIRYMPPEQLECETRAPTVDLFAVGAILHELLDGKRFRGGTLDENRLIGMCAKGEVPALTCPPESVPVELERLRKGLLEPAVADRIRSARAAHRLLSQWPGDRDAKFELEEIVRDVVGITSRATAPSFAEALPHDSDVALQEGSEEPANTELLPHEALDTDVARRRASEEATDERSREKSVTAPVIPSLAPTSRKSSSRLLAVVLAGLGLALALAGTSVMFGWWEDGEEPPVAVKRIEQPGGTPARLEPPSSEARPKPELEQVKRPSEMPRKAEPQQAENLGEAPSEPVPVTPQENFSPEPAKVPPAEPRQVPKTSVTIRADGVFAQVKVAGKEHTLDRLAGIKSVSAKIKPGDYTVWFRDDSEEPWQPFGKVTIPQGDPVTLDVKDGAVSVGK